MASSSAFEWLCDSLEAATDLDRLEARGTVRIALKSAGLEAGGLTADQTKVVLEKLMPSELEGRGIDAAASICGGLAARISEIPDTGAAASGNSPEEVFARLG
jgi:hypothetical protein